MYRRFQASQVGGSSSAPRVRGRPLGWAAVGDTTARLVSSGPPRFTQHLPDRSDVTNGNPRLLSLPPVGDVPRASLELSDSALRQLLRGDVRLECPSPARLVRLYVSSAGPDTLAERRALQERGPGLRERCREEGFDLQLLDLNWAMGQDDRADDHCDLDIRLREVEISRRLSTGPFFLMLVSHKYGARYLPREIELDEFEVLLADHMTEDEKHLLRRWYIRDFNSIPPTYVLQPISTHIPDITSGGDAGVKAQAQWKREFDKMRTALTRSARETLSEEHAHKYVVSGMEAEILKAVLGERGADAKRCLWIQRKIANTEDEPHNAFFREFIDSPEDGDGAAESVRLLTTLTRSKLTSAVPSSRRLVHHVAWSKDGIAPQKHEAHRKYVQQVYAQSEKMLVDMVEETLKKRKRSNVNDRLLGEVLQHTITCQAKARHFQGREDVIKKLDVYLRGGSNLPCVLHGASGCGKSSIMSVAARRVWKIVGNKANVVIRFIGTTPHSTHIGELLSSLIHQIRYIYDEDESDLPADLRELSEVFWRELRGARATCPLIIFLDALDQIDPTGGARQLSWLPEVLPNHVKVILSTLPGKEYEVFPKLQRLIRQQENFLEVPPLYQSEILEMTTRWLALERRRLTEYQRSILEQAWQKCSLPLYLRLTVQEACRWGSYLPPDRTALSHSLRGSIAALYARAEQAEGEVFVARALAYITLSIYGLSESELLDVMSCDDEVLDSVLPTSQSVRRMPPLKLSRLRYILGHALVERVSDGMVLIHWSHRQFMEVALETYCKDEALCKKLHSNIADYFAGVWAKGVSKPWVDSVGQTHSADRLVASQPMQWGALYNYRKLQSLPMQRLAAGQLTQLKSECLVNFPFLLAKLKACGLRSLLWDLSAARRLNPGDTELKTVGGALLLSQDALVYNPHELPSQLLGRITNTEGLETLLLDCRNAPDPFLLPNRRVLVPPGGQLECCLSGHSGDILGLDITQDQKFAVTSGSDGTVRVWNVEEGRLERTIDRIGPEPEVVVVCCADTMILVHPERVIRAFYLHSGKSAYKIKMLEERVPFAVTGNERRLVAVFLEDTAFIHEAVTGDVLTSVRCCLDAPIKFGSCSNVAGCQNCVAVTDADMHDVVIFHTASMTFRVRRTVFPPFLDEDGELDHQTVDAMTLTSTGDVLYLSSMEDNNIHAFETDSMTLIQTFEGTKTDFPQKYHVTTDARFLYFANGDEVVARNLVTGVRHVVLSDAALDDAATLDMRRMVTVGADRMVKMWDLTKSDHSRKVILKEGTEPLQTSKVLRMVLLPSPRYVLLKLERNSGYLLQIYDLGQNKAVRELLYEDVTLPVLLPLDGKTLLVQVERKLKVLDLETLSVLRSFQGKVAAMGGDAVLIKHNKELITTSRGRLNLKVYDVSTGDVIKIMTAGQKKRIDDILVNKYWTVLAAGTDEGPCLVFDLTCYNFLFSLEPDLLEDGAFYLGDSTLTSNGGFLLTQDTIVPPGTTLEVEETVVVVFDLETRQIARYLVDMEDYHKYHGRRRSLALDTSLDNFRLLDDRTVLSAHMDYVLRIFDIRAGTLLRRLHGHIGALDICLEASSPFILTLGIWSEENAMRLWDKHSCTFLASYSLDVEFKCMELARDGRHIVGCVRGDSQPVVWGLRGGRRESTPAKDKAPAPFCEYPSIFSEPVVMKMVELKTHGDSDEDSDDPDADVDEMCDDSDDFDGYENDGSNLDSDDADIDSDEADYEDEDGDDFEEAEAEDPIVEGDEEEELEDEAFASGEETR